MPSLSSNLKFKRIFGEIAAEVERLTSRHEVMKDSIGPQVMAPIDVSQPSLRILDAAIVDRELLALPVYR